MYTNETAITEILRIQKEKYYRAIDGIKQNKDLVNFIKSEFAKNYPNEKQSLPAQVWLLLHEGYDLICPYGNRRRLRKSRNGSQFNCIVSCKCTLDGRHKTMLNKYGVLAAQQLKEVRAKSVATCLKKYGSKSANGNKDIMTKQKQTRKVKCLQTYGVPHEKQIHFSNETKEILSDSAQFVKMLVELGTRKMAERLGVSKSTIVVYHRKLKLNVISRVRSCYEIELANWLKTQNIEFMQNDMKQIKPKELDFYLPKYKVAIEIQGDYWHGNPKQFKSTDMIRSNRGLITVSEIWQRDKYKQELCKNKGINLISFWEDEWLTDSNKIKLSILEKLKKV